MLPDGTIFEDEDFNYVDEEYDEPWEKGVNNSTKTMPVDEYNVADDVTKTTPPGTTTSSANWTSNQSLIGILETTTSPPRTLTTSTSTTKTPRRSTTIKPDVAYHLSLRNETESFGSIVADLRNAISQKNHFFQYQDLQGPILYNSFSLSRWWHA